MSRWTDEEIQRMETDEDYWDHSTTADVAEAGLPENRGTVFSVRMTPQQARLIGEAADEAGLSPLDFIREAAIQRASAHQAAPRRLAKP